MHKSLPATLMTVLAAFMLVSVHASPLGGCSAAGVHILINDRTHPFRTKLPVNQPYLNKIALPTDAAVLVRTFTALAEAQAQLPLGCYGGRSVRRA